MPTSIETRLRESDSGMLSPLSLPRLTLSALLLTVALTTPAIAAQVRGSLELQMRSFLNDPLDPAQHNHYPSAAINTEFYYGWNKQNDALTFTPFGRYDAHDSERTHVDLRELNWLHVGNGWQLRTGISKVFWGSTESRHLVDIINQTDNLEGLDGEDKLGQPMAHFSYLLEQGELSLFWLPYFRERHFVGSQGRPRTTPLPVNTGNPTYNSDRGRHHQDVAIRWSYYFDRVDVALSHFSGTSREPTLSLNSPNPLTATALNPHYELIEQTGLELTSALGSWLWKLEAISNSGLEAGRYSAAVAGFEYSFIGLFDSSLDLGVLAEYLYDDRNQLATSPFQDDLFLGLRLTLNDFQSTELLTGLIVDNDSQATLGFIEASRRLGSQFKASLEARVFDRLAASDPLYSQREDNFVQLNLEYFF
ncbi:MAG: hypothetical protein ACJAWL_002448 [Motiliproteus sp.]|jgi:hypothetical protein